MIDPALLLGIGGGVVALVAAAGRAFHRARSRAFADAAASLDTSDTHRAWVGEGPSSLAGYDTQTEAAGDPIHIDGWKVRTGERRHARHAPQKDGSLRAVAHYEHGFVALLAADLPPDARRAWRMPPREDEGPLAQLVRAQWAQLSTHLDDRLELTLPDQPDAQPQATLAAARRLVAGARALLWPEAGLAAWLAAPPRSSARTDISEAAWRASLLLKWLDHRPEVQDVARRMLDAEDAELRARAALVRGDLHRLLDASRDPGTPEPLRRQALVRGTEVAVAAADHRWLDAAVGVALHIHQAPEAVAEVLVAAQDPKLVPALTRLFEALADDLRHAGPLLRCIEALGGSDAVRTRALSSADHRARSLAEAAFVAALGPAATAQRCLAVLARIAADTLEGTPVFEEEVRASWLLQGVGRHGAPEHLAHLRSWAESETPDGRPARTVREAVAVAIEAIRARMPAGLVGGLSVAAGEAGALSVAAPPKAEDQ